MGHALLEIHELQAEQEILLAIQELEAVLLAELALLKQDQNLEVAVIDLQHHVVHLQEEGKTIQNIYK